jgi:hypothetical protein
LPAILNFKEKMTCSNAITELMKNFRYCALIATKRRKSRKLCPQNIVGRRLLGLNSFSEAHERANYMRSTRAPQEELIDLSRQLAQLRPAIAKLSPSSPDALKRAIELQAAVDRLYQNYLAINRRLHSSNF